MESAKKASVNILALQQPWSTKLPYCGWGRPHYDPEEYAKHQEEQEYAYAWQSRTGEIALTVKVIRQIEGPHGDIWGMTDARALFVVGTEKYKLYTHTGARASLERFLQYLADGHQFVYQVGELVYVREQAYGGGGYPLAGFVLGLETMPVSGVSHYRVDAYYTTSWHRPFITSESGLSRSYNASAYTDQKLILEMLEAVTSWKEVYEEVQPLLALAPMAKQQAFLLVARSVYKLFENMCRIEADRYLPALSEETLYAFADELQTWYETP